MHSQNHQKQQQQSTSAPSGIQLIESLKSKHLGFYSLHLLSKTLLSRSLGFTFVLGPRYFNDEKQKGNNNKSSPFSTTTSLFSFNYEDILDMNIIGAPVAVGDVAYCASEFLKHPDLDRTLSFAVENLVADRRCGVSAEQQQQQEGSFNFDKELQEGVALCKTIFRFIAAPSNSNNSSSSSSSSSSRKLMDEFLPSFCSEEWSDGVIRMAKSRIFCCMTRLICKGIFLADFENKIRNSNNAINNDNKNNESHSLIDIMFGSSSAHQNQQQLASFPLRSKKEIEAIIAHERQRLHSSSQTFTSSQIKNNLFLKLKENIGLSPSYR